MVKESFETGLTHEYSYNVYMCGAEIVGPDVSWGQLRTHRNREDTEYMKIAPKG